MNNTHPLPLVAIVEPNDVDAATIRTILVESQKAHVVGAVKDTGEIAHLMSAYPDILLLNVSATSSDLASAIQEIHDYSPQCQVILTASADSGVDIERAMRAGARGLLRKPVNARELTDYVQEVFTTEQRRFRRIEEVAKLRATQGRAGVVITVFSAKGGVGCTMIAANLALALVQLTKGSVALVDFDLQFGDLGVVLNLHSSHGLHELLRNVDDLDNAILEDVMVRHPSGIRVLLPPPTFAQVEEVDTESMLAVVKALRKHNDFVVIDMWHSVEEATMAVLDHSSVLLVVTTPEVPALRNTRRLLDLLREQPGLRDKIRVVVNRFPSKSAVRLDDIQTSLGVAPFGTVTSDGRLITTAINEGVSLLTTKSHAAQSLMQIAKMLAQPHMARLQVGKDQADSPQAGARSR